MGQLLVAEAGFLVDDKVKAALESLPPEEGDLARAESLLRALGVDNEHDVKALLEYFFPKPIEGDDDVINAMDAPHTAEETPAAFLELQRLISADQVVQAVHNYVESRKVGPHASVEVAKKLRESKDKAATA